MATLDPTTGKMKILERVRSSAYDVPTLLDEATAMARRDINRVGVTNFTDLSAVLGAYGAGLSTTSSAYTPEMDVSANGSIDFADQNAVLNGYTHSYTYRWQNRQSLHRQGMASEFDMRGEVSLGVRWKRGDHATVASLWQVVPVPAAPSAPARSGGGQRQNPPLIPPGAGP